MKPDFDSFALGAEQDPIRTVRQNLSEIGERQRPLFLARAFHLGDLIATASPAEPLTRDEIMEICERLFPKEISADQYDKAVRYADLISLCTEIATLYPQGYEHVFSQLFGQDAPPAQDALGRVAYVANSYTEQAFMELTGFITHRRVAYFHHFDDVCQEVRGGLCEYGILPVESTAEGLMAGLFRLIELYDLRICALCRISAAQDSHTAFALVRKSIPPIEPQSSHCLDILCSPTDQDEISELICVSSLCGHTLLHTATYQGQDSETFRLRFSVQPSTLYPFLIYLALFCADITPIGIYTIK